MRPQLNPKAIYEFEHKETSHPLSFFLPYELEISLPGDVIIELGRFSLGLLARIHVIPPYSGGARLSIGAFCESAMGATILVGGDHPNDSLLNHAFGAYFDYYHQFMPSEARAAGMAPSKPIAIGDNVVLSRGALLVGAADVGTGCVIGAGAIVTGVCEPFGIYAGVPARLIRKRFDAELLDLYRAVDLPNICAHCIPTLPLKVAQLQAKAIDVHEFRSSVDYLPMRPRLHVSGVLKDGSIGISSVNGFSVGGEMVTDPPTVEKLKNYLAQPAMKPSRVKWSPDIFYALGLYG